MGIFLVKIVEKRNSVLQFYLEPYTRSHTTAAYTHKIATDVFELVHKLQTTPTCNNCDD